MTKEGFSQERFQGGRQHLLKGKEKNGETRSAEEVDGGPFGRF